ncbi:hypothetical protein AAG570_000651 [Ranatra chinensis]|uniref:Uncharacterized protein n=1 Tax=Ranatra chinensis TaxID=642074 RepID=A0ABD0YYE8_9HEMI
MVKTAAMYDVYTHHISELTEKPSLMLLKTAQKRWENDMYEERPQFYEACETKGQPTTSTLAEAVKDGKPKDSISNLEDCKTKKLPTENSENSSGTEDVPAVKAEENDMPNSLRPDLEKDTGKTNGAEHDNFYKISLWEGPKDKFDGHPLKPTRKREHLPSPVEENEGRETTGSKISMEENESLCQSWSSMYSNGFEDEFGFTLYWSLIQMSLLELLMEMELFETFRQLAMAVIQKRNGSKEGSEELRDMPILEKIIESSHQEECDLRQRRSGNQEISSQQGSKGQRKTVLGKSWADNLLEECLEEEVQILSQMGELWGLIEYARGEKHGRTVGKSLVEMMRQEGLEEELEALRKLATSSRAQLSLLAEGRAMAVAYRRGAGSALEDRQSSLLLDYASEYLSWMRATIRQRPPAKSSLAAQLAAKATMSLVSPASHISLTKPSKASAAPLSKPRKINYDTTSIHLPDGLVESAITNGLRRAKRPAEAAITLQGLTEPRNLDDLEETTREADEPGPDISLFQNKELYLDAAVQYWSRWLPQNCI